MTNHCISYNTGIVSSTHYFTFYTTSFPPTLPQIKHKIKKLMTQNKYFILHINNSKQTMQCLRHRTGNIEGRFWGWLLAWLMTKERFAEILGRKWIAGIVVVVTIRRAYHSASKQKFCSCCFRVCCLMLLLLFKGFRKIISGWKIYNWIIVKIFRLLL